MNIEDVLEKVDGTEVHDEYYLGFSTGLEVEEFELLIDYAKKAKQYEEALIQIRNFSVEYTTANNFEDVDPELVANEVFEISNNVLSENQ